MPTASPTPDPFAEFLQRTRELKDLAGVVGLLSWDQETCLPSRAVEARARHLATLQAVLHERLVAPSLGELAERLAARGDLDEAQRAMVRNLRWERERAVRIPPRLVRELAEAQARAVDAWRGARRDSDFAAFRPHLEQLLRLRREQADAIGYDRERYDALLEGFEPGMRTARLEPLFAALRARLVPLVEAIAASRRPIPTPFAGKTFDPDRQQALSLRLLKELGFDLEAGRLDRSSHPFTGGPSDPTDVRLTTRLLPDNPLSGLMSTIHEGGHGLYEQGFLPEHAGTYVGQAPSLGLHESQSRFWENLIGRSLAFWRHWLPVMREAFPAELKGVEVDEVFRAVNEVRPSPIRVEADEVTYNLHVLLRFELEVAMLRDDLRIADLPGAWDERMQHLLGIRPRNAAEGVLQDIHWAWGELGYFPTYTLGNLYSAMLAQRLGRDLPDLASRVERGEYGAILGWLREKIHRRGHLLPAEQLVEQVSGRTLSVDPFIDYLERKYRPLYGLA